MRGQIWQREPDNNNGKGGLLTAEAKLYYLAIAIYKQRIYTNVHKMNSAAAPTIPNTVS